MPLAEFWIAFSVTMLLVVGFGVCLALDKRRSVWVDRRFPGTGRTRVLYGDYAGAGHSEHRMYTTERLYRGFKARRLPIGGALMHLTPCVIPTDPTLIEHVLSDAFVKVRPDAPGMEPFCRIWNAFEEERFEELLKVAHEESDTVTEGVRAQDEIIVDVKTIAEQLVVRTLARSIFGRKWNDQRQLPISSVIERRPANVVGRIVATTFPDAKIVHRLTAFFHLDSPTLLEELVYSLLDERTTKQHFLLYLQTNESQASKTDRLPFGHTKALLLELVQNVFFIASGTLIACLYELAQRPELQNRLHTVLRQSGDSMVDDLDKVIGETLRKYPPVDEISFISAANNRLPGCDLVVPRNTTVTIPIYAIQRDAEYYPDPARFDPARPTFRSTGKSFRSCPYRPLGAGPLPVGANFAMMVVRVGLTHILARCSVQLTHGSPTVLEVSPTSAMPYPRGKVLLLIKSEVQREGSDSSK